MEREDLIRVSLAIAERLLDSGASLSLWDADEKLVESTADGLSKRGKVHFHAVNVTNGDAVQRAAETAAKLFGQIDILVTSARITGPNVKCWEYPVDAWQQVIDVNLNGSSIAAARSCRL